ncbi:pentatricopeptide repeat-containing protein At2g30780-like [Bidens hawaiensis]|uniref:pentatricopeptide repeat-containing protein At2g30780-like n=1 Tax=Bidens hawaiensis TaxID=980011 RepID=UPI00404B98B8
MKRIFRICDGGSAKVDLLYCPRGYFISKFLTNPTTISNTTRWVYTESSSSKAISELYGQFADKWAYADVRSKEEMFKKVSLIKDDLMKDVKDGDSFENLLEVEGLNLLKMYSDGAAFVELLRLLESSPHLAIKAFNWRRKKDEMRPMSPEEYAKGIKLAGRVKDVDLAVDLFREATNKRIKNTSIYNALVGAYMYNGLSEKCNSVFLDLKQDINCQPTSATFNMLISVYGRRVLVDQMETVFQEMKDYNIAPDIITYNNMITGYLTAWMWESMETTYRLMETGLVRANLDTHLLMLRGFAHSGNLEKMEHFYNILGPRVLREKHVTLIRAMICAYCKAPNRNRVKRIKELMRLIPENEYKPWLNVLLIRVYAEEDLVDQMDESIHEAFDHNTSVNTVKIMHTITSTYIRNNAVDKLATFIARAGRSGWRMRRALYHELMWVLASQKRIDEMEQVLTEMERFSYGWSKGTLIILFKAYSGQKEQYRHKFYRVLGLMCKHGYGSIAGELDDGCRL